MTQDGTQESYDNDAFTVAVRQYILDTLTPLLPAGDQTGRFIYKLLQRALRSASRDDLEQVVLHCVAFTEGLRREGFITEALAQEASDYLQPHSIPGLLHNARGEPIEDFRDPAFDPTSGTADRVALPGPGTVDWTDEEWQEHSRQALDSGLSTDDDEGTAQGLEPSTDSGGGHQAEMEGDTDTNGEESTEAVPEDGAG